MAQYQFGSNVNTKLYIPETKAENLAFNEQFKTSSDVAPNRNNAVYSVLSHDDEECATLKNNSY